MNMNGYREESSSWCYFHPKEIVIGVCPLCLNERLLVLAAKQGGADRHSHLHLPSSKPYTPSRKPSISFPKIFAFGNSLLHRHWKSDFSDDKSAVSTSPEEESFISIKFEDNGAASWEKGNGSTNNSKVCVEQCIKSYNNNYNKQLDKQALDNKERTITVVEHAKPRATMRWRKRIGHLFHVIRWKRSNRTNVCHVGTKVDGVKVRKGWIRTLTKRRTKE